MTYVRVIGVAMLLLASAGAYADPCKIAIDSNDMMQFSAHELAVPTSCTDVEVTLRHAGRLPAKVMGHDWVLAKDSDVSGIVNAGLAAGLTHGFVPENDKRIIAATKVVGGGESTTVKFSTALLLLAMPHAWRRRENNVISGRGADRNCPRRRLVPAAGPETSASGGEQG